MKDVCRLAAPDRQHAVRRNRLYRLAIVEIHLESLLLVWHVDGLAADDHAIIEHQLTQSLAHGGVLADHFGNDVARAFERLPHVGDSLSRIHKPGRECFERVGLLLLLP